MPYKDPIKRRQFANEYYKKQRELYPEKYRLYRRQYRLKNIDKIREQDRKQQQTWKNCIVCNKPIFGYKKKKYCDDCHLVISQNMLKGNQYWKEVNPQNRPRGKSHPSWRGGITFWKKRIWDSPKYKKWRKEVFERDNYTCQKCGAKNGEGKSIYLEAHHKKSFTELLRKYNIKSLEDANNCNEIWDIGLGITLCFKCHNKTKNGRPKKSKRN